MRALSFTFRNCTGLTPLAAAAKGCAGNGLVARCGALCARRRESECQLSVIALPASAAFDRLPPDVVAVKKRR